MSTNPTPQGSVPAPAPKTQGLPVPADAKSRLNDAVQDGVQEARGEGLSKVSQSKGALTDLGIGKRTRLFQDESKHYLADELQDAYDRFIETQTVYLGAEQERHDIPRNGMLAEIIKHTTILLYDLPELMARVSTGFVDTTGRMYISVPFFEKLLADDKAGKDGIEVMLRHEAEHLRRMHLQRMVEFPHSLANIAQDIRINLDIARMAAIQEMIADRNTASQVSDPSAVEKAVQNYLTNTLGSAMRIAHAFTWADHQKWGLKSEEAIAAELLKEYKASPKTDPETEVSFPKVCEGVAQDMDAIETAANVIDPKTKAPVDAQTAQAAHNLAGDLRRVAKDPKAITKAEYQKLLSDLVPLMSGKPMADRDMEHKKIQLAAGTGAPPPPSVKTGDAFVDTLTPSMRALVLFQLLNMILNPKQGVGGPSNGGVRVKDLPMPPQPGTSANEDMADGNSDRRPNANVYHGDDHVLTGEEVKDILERNGLHDVAQKLGYDELEKIEEKEAASRDAAMGAINQAREDQMRVSPSRYPGSHMVDYAVAQVADFYRPVLNWKSRLKETIAEAGMGSRYEFEEPWQVYYAEPSDLGVGSVNDIPYMGSNVPGSSERPVILVPVDTSGSVDDAMLKRFITEAVNMARDNDSGDSAPEVIVVFADTMGRGTPVLITPESYQEFLKKGLNYGGRGGTNFQASLEHCFDMLKDGGALEGRKLDSIVYFTDTFDMPPDQYALEEAAFSAGMSKLPTLLFLAPKSCFNEAFTEGVSAYAECIYFDTKKDLTVDFEDLDQSIESRGHRRSRP
jgi:hypothetical protein